MKTLSSFPFTFLLFVFLIALQIFEQIQLYFYSEYNFVIATAFDVAFLKHTNFLLFLTDPLINHY